MALYSTLDDLPLLKEPVALTLGTFDGVHAGHRALIAEVKRYGTPLVLTFRNHPLGILVGKAPKELCTFEEKVRRLEAQGIEHIVALTFTEKLAALSYRAFLEEVRRRVSFKTLVLGEGATFGARNEGTEERVKELGEEMGFEAIYVPKLKVGGEVVSSTSERLIRGPVNCRYY